MHFISGNHSISKIESFGELITMDDGSKLKVILMDKSKSMMWMILDDVTISTGFIGSHRITHIKRNETVEANLL